MKQEIRIAKPKYLPTTSNLFLKTYNPIKVKRELIEVDSIPAVFNTSLPTLGEIKRTYGTKQVEAYIKLWLIELNEVLNLKRPMKAHQIDECAMLICQKYNALSIADINLIFKRVKMGEMGELFESLSIHKLMKWFANYFDERCDVAGSQSRQAHSRHTYAESKGRRASVVNLKEHMQAQKEYKYEQAKKNFDNDIKQNNNGKTKINTKEK